ncbi:MAG: hypothetical protein V3V32_04570 [Dehalococcoidia bacterium]
MNVQVENALKAFLETVWDAAVGNHNPDGPCKRCIEQETCVGKELFCIDAVLGLLRDEDWTPRYR